MSYKKIKVIWVDITIYTERINLKELKNVKPQICETIGYLIKEEKDYTDLPKGKLGIHDNYMNKQFISEINQLKQPFIASWFTVSTHMPFDYEGTKKRLTPLEVRQLDEGLA